MAVSQLGGADDFFGGIGAPTDAGYLSIAANYGAFAALKADGSITAWGDSDWGGSGAPTDAGYVSIAANAWTFAALKANGSITAWGRSDFGGSGAPTDSGYISINGVGPQTPTDCSFTRGSNKIKPALLLLEFFARQVAYDKESLLKNEGDTLPPGHFAAGWTLEEVFIASYDLFRAVALYKPGYRPVLAIRGTALGIPDWLENTDLEGVGFEEFEDAWANTGIKQWLIDNPHASITGHSQGGAQAQLLAYRAAEKTSESEPFILGQLVTFNSAGINETDIDLSEVLDTVNVIHFISAGDIVSQVGVHFVPSDVIYYDLDYQYPSELFLPEQFEHVLLPQSAHSDHWAQEQLYFAEFLREDNEDLPEYQPVRRLHKNLLSYDDFISSNFSHLYFSDADDIINYADLDYQYFKQDVLTFFSFFPSLREFTGLELIRIAEILSSREKSESGRIEELPKILRLVDDHSSIMASLVNRLPGMTADLASNTASKLFSLAIDLGHTIGDGPRDYAIFMITTAYDLGHITAEGIVNVSQSFGSTMIDIGDFFLDGAEEGFKRFAEKSEDFASWVMPRITPNKSKSLIIVEGSNAASTPAIIVDRESGDSTMTSASGSSIFLLGEGKETVILSGEDNIVFGFPEAIDQTRVENFGITDALFIGEVKLEQSDLSVREGSAILSLDTDDDNHADVEITLLGNFSLAHFVVEASSSGTYIRYTFDENIDHDHEGRTGAGDSSPFTPETNDCSGNSVVINPVSYPNSTVFDCRAQTAIMTQGNVVIETGADVLYMAPSVILKPGFQAQQGSFFHGVGATEVAP